MRSGSVLRAPVHPPFIQPVSPMHRPTRACRSPRRIFHLPLPDDLSGIVVRILHRGTAPLDQGKISMLIQVRFHKDLVAVVIDPVDSRIAFVNLAGFRSVLEYLSDRIFPNSSQVISRMTS